MTTVVVDACVSLKWALDDEEAIAQANALRDSAIRGDLSFVAPGLWVYEIVNALVVASRRNRVTGEVAHRARRAILSVGVRLVDPIPEKVHQLAYRYSISAYDAAYLSLADSLDVLLWTGDRRFYTGVSDGTDRVRWIGDYR